MHDAPATSPFRQPRAVWAVAFACVVSFMGIGLVDPILKSLAGQLHATPTQVELLFTSYLVVTAVAMLVTGWVSSRTRRQAHPDRRPRDHRRVRRPGRLVRSRSAASSASAPAGASATRSSSRRRWPSIVGSRQRRLRRRDHPVRDRARRRHRARARWSAACSAASAGAARSSASRVLMAIALVATILLLPATPAPARKQRLANRSPR